MPKMLTCAIYMKYQGVSSTAKTLNLLRVESSSCSLDVNPVLQASFGQLLLML
jgi:hypothetical protein